MTLTVLKSEDIVFRGADGEKIVNLQKLDLNKIATIEGVSEFSVLQLEHKGDSYLLTEEFVVDATLETLDEFLEEYDEEDEDEVDFDLEEVLLSDETDDVLEENFEEEFQSETAQKEENEQKSVEEERVQTQLRQGEEEQRIDADTLHPFYQNKELISFATEALDLGEGLFTETMESITEENVLAEISELEETQSSEEPTVEITSTTNTTVSLVQIETLIESNNSVEERTLAIGRLESETLKVGDLKTLGVTGLSDNSSNIARINNILVDDGVTIGSDTAQLQALVDVLIKIDAKDGESSATNITRNEWQLIGLDHVSSPDANELNIALANSNSLALGLNPQSNLQLIGDSLNALDQVKYGNSTGVSLTDLTNIGVVGVNEGGDEPTLEAVNTVLFDPDVSADHTNSVQDVVDALFVLNESTGDTNVEINAFGLETLGITSTFGFSEDELDYINNRISENDDYRNDVVELQNLVDFIGDKNIYIGTAGDDTISYNNAELHDGQDGFDTLVVDAGMSIDLSEIKNIEEIVLNNNNSTTDTTLGTALDEINAADVIAMTDDFNLLFIDENGVNGTETVHLDTNEFTFQVLSAGYNYYTANGGTVTVAIDENIIVE